MLRVGITGGIGSGKSTVCRIFEQLGVPVFYADRETKWLYNNNTTLRSAVIAAFGETVYSGTALNKPLLAQMVFEDAEKLRLLNSIVHPFVFELYEQWCQEHANAAYTLKEAAIMFESGSYKQVHKVIGVSAPLELRIQRVANRDGVEPKMVLARIKNQLEDEELKSRCDYIIINDGEHSLIEQVTALHLKFLSISSQSPLPPFRRD
jgi:dephospho-CoA kinase